MPQMAPINWLSLFITFSVIFVLINSINYFILNNCPPSSSTNQYLTTNLVWKW